MQLKIFVITLLFAQLIFIGCAGTPKSDLAQLHLRVGTNHLSLGNYPDALKELMTAESYDSSDPVIQNNLGLAYFMRERLDMADKHLRRALSIEPKYTEARNNLARVLIERKKYEEADKLLNLCLQDLTFPQPAKIYVNLGLLKFNTEKYEDSRNAFQKAITYERENCLSQNYYGRSLLELRQFEQAAIALDRATVMCTKSKFDEPTYFAALAYFRLGDKFKTKARLELIRNPESKFYEKAKGMLKLLGN